ncbi:MAG: MotA/TolQ/ExbB proton channel family protein [Paludibacteraceae bacterium]|nr:MotA/TolQ/ExbB proton channel family protein [Paludibacteraceae bacterium]
MKKVFAVLAILGVFAFGMTSNIFAQDDEYTSDETTVQQDEAPAAAPAATPAAQEAAPAPQVQEQELGTFKTLKIKFIEGGAGFMACVALCLILGLALCIERIIYLSLASANTKKLLEQVETALLEDNDVEAAKEACANTRGPIASIFYQGLMRIDEGADVVEKAVASYGGVQMGLLEKNVTWISLCIALGPMLGFMGTVIGMIAAFDKIQQMGDISATIVAGGIKVALLTTVFGLIVAMILQVFLNFILTRIEALVSEMEDTSISLVDTVIKYQAQK